MIKTKTKVKDKSKKTSFSIKGMSKTKKMILGIGFATVALLSWDVSTITSDSVKIQNTINYKVNHYNALTNYNNFKNQINAVPYTDADFKRDFTIFESIYGHQDQPIYRKLVDNYMKDRGGVGLSTLMLEKYRYKDINKRYEDVMAYSKTMKDLPEQQFSPQVHVILKSEDLPYGDIHTRKMISSGLRLGLYYSIYGEGMSADNRIYSNMEKMLQEEGYNKSSFFLPPEFIAKRDSSYKENKYDEFKKEQNTIQEDSMNEIMTYYKNGDMKKLKGLFRLANAFSYVMVDDPINNNINNFDYALPVSLMVKDMLDPEDDLSIFSISQEAQKKSGNGSSQKDAYYRNTLGIFY